MINNIEATFHMLTESKKYEMYTESGQEELRIYADCNGDNCLRFSKSDIDDLMEFVQYVEEHKYNV